MIYCLQSRVYSYIVLTFVFLLLSFVPTTAFQILNVVSATLESGGGGDISNNGNGNTGAGGDDSGGDVGDLDSGNGGGDQPEPGPNPGPEPNPDPDPNPGLVADPTPKPPTDPCEENPKAEGCAPEPPVDPCIEDHTIEGCKPTPPGCNCPPGQPCPQIACKPPANLVTPPPLVPEPLDDDCLYDPSLPKCASIDGKCPEGFNMNEDGQCYPDKPCPLGFARVDNDESGACLPVDQV